MSLEGEIKYAQETVTQVKTVLNGLKLSGEHWSIVVAGMIHQGIEHHESIMLLIQSRLTGSAFALCRSVVEILVRGAWFTCCATEQEAKEFIEHDEINLNFHELANAIDQSQQIEFFADFKKKYWSALNSYAHAGILQLGRRWTEGKLLASYGEEETREVISACTMCILLLVQPYLAKNGYPEASQKIVALGQYWKERMQ